MERKLNRVIIIILLIIFMDSYSYGEELDYYEKRNNWFPSRGTNMNISHYVYHDMNRNGIYDIDDRPLVDFAIKMTRPDGSSVVRRSNLNGFVNFTHSLLDKPVDIYEPGEYTFELIVPEGWIITSGNKIQKINYRESVTKRSSLVPDKVPLPVGLIQEPKIEGRVQRADGKPLVDTINFSVKMPDGRIIKIDLTENGKFELKGEYGIWTIFIYDKINEKYISREVNMGTIPVKMSTIIVDDKVLDKKQYKKLIDFEDITYSNIQKIPNGVGNINFYNLIVTDFLLYKGEGYVNNRISGKYVGYNTSGQPVTLSKPEGFDFYGGYFGVAWRKSAEGEILVARAYRGDKLIDEKEFKLSALGPFYFDADYRNITRLELFTKHQWQFVTDNILIGTD